MARQRSALAYVRPVIRALAGPLLIVTSVLAVLHDFAFRGLITLANQDVAAYFLPTYCLMGRSLAEGHIPAWNPYAMAGAPFAADPQSGWMYLPVMALFSVLSCDVAIRMYIVVLPILAGLGLYWFLRAEDVSRIAATTGGLVLSLAVAGSRLAINLPFSASLAWTALLLAAAARFLRAQSWAARLAWAAVTALAWGQLAAAHLSHGLILGTGALVTYLLARALSDLRQGRSRREVLLLVGILMPALFLVNLAYFLPRLSYLPRTTLGLSYAGLQELSDRLVGRAPRPFQIGPTAAPTWLMLFAISPGLLPGGRASCAIVRRLVEQGAAGPGRRVQRLRLCLLPAFLERRDGTPGSCDPSVAIRRLLLPQPPSVPLRIATRYCGPCGSWPRGVEECEQHSSSTRHGHSGDRAVGSGSSACGCGSSSAVVVGGRSDGRGGRDSRGRARRRGSAALAGQTSSREPESTGLPRGRGFRQLSALLEPTIDAALYVQPGPIALAIRSENAGRYLSLNPSSYVGVGYRRPSGWPFLTNQRSFLFRIEEAQGYNPVVPLQYWTFIRKMNPRSPTGLILRDPPPIALNLLQVTWVIARSGAPPERGAVAVASEGAWTLYRRADAPPRASLVTEWIVEPNDEAALNALTEQEFDPERQAILEQDAIFAQSPASSRSRKDDRSPARAVYLSAGPQAARINLDAPARGIVVIRHNYDPNWHATVDGRPVPIVRANYFLQAVPVPGGRHTIRLTYDDPWIGYGLLGSTLALGIMVAAALLARRARPGKRPPPRPAAPDARPSPPSPAG